ncbi:MAG TPA: hypothetical protein VGK74_27755 [Symbiobacteriaceae bacterium]|jgi:hypothetical protein
MQLCEWLEDGQDGGSSADQRDEFRGLFEAKALELLHRINPVLEPEVVLLQVSPYEPDEDESFQQITVTSGNTFQSSVLIEGLKSIPHSGNGRRTHDFFADVENALRPLLSKACPGKMVFLSETLDGTLYGHILILIIGGALASKVRWINYPANNPLPPDSLLEAAAEVFITECSAELVGQFPPMFKEIFGIRVQELLRASACNLMRIVAAQAAVSNDDGQEVYEAFESVAAELYEGAPARGSIVVASPTTLGDSIRVLFAEPIIIEPRTCRHIRKLLETTTGSMALLVYSTKRSVNKTRDLSIHGLVDASEIEDVFRVDFKGHRSWELSRGSIQLMRVMAGVPSAPQYESRFRQEASMRFAGLAGIADIERLWNLVSAAPRQKHGTIVIVAADAESEAKRLICTQIDPDRSTFDQSMVEDITAIDGALIFDPKGRCHAMGAILKQGPAKPDLLARMETSPSRGSRYNSAVEYVKFAPSPRLAVVVSVDGSIDVI